MKLWKLLKRRNRMTRREVDALLDSVLDILREQPDETRERHPECRWRDTERLARIDAAARVLDIKACLRGKVEIPTYFEKYKIYFNKRGE